MSINVTYVGVTKALPELLETSRSYVSSCNDAMKHNLPEVYKPTNIAVMVDELLSRPTLTRVNRYNKVMVNETVYWVVIKHSQHTDTIHAFTEDENDDELIIGIRTNSDHLEQTTSSLMTCYNRSHLGIHSLKRTDLVEEVDSNVHFSFTDDLLDRLFENNEGEFYDALANKAELLTPDYVVSLFFRPDSVFAMPVCFDREHLMFYKALQTLHRRYAGDDRVGQLLISINRAHIESKERLKAFRKLLSKQN